MVGSVCCGGMHGRGCAWQGHVWQGMCVVGRGGVCGRRDGHCSRQYASYWNAFLLVSFVTTHKRSLGQGNIFRSMCQEFCSQGGLPQCMLEYYPPGPGRHPLGPGRYPHWDQAPPRPGGTPRAEHAGRYGQRAGGTHPTGLQSCFYIFPTYLPFSHLYSIQKKNKCKS